MRIHDRTLLQWLQQPVPDRGVYFGAPGDNWDHWSYLRLADLVHRYAGGLVERGTRAGDVVVVVARSGPAFVAAMFGAMVAGATACAIAPRFGYQRGEDYERHLTHVLGRAGPAVTVVDTDSQKPVQQALHRTGLAAPVLCDELGSGAPIAAPRPPADVPLLQFTSGSSGYARGVLISHRALESNLAAIRDWLRLREGDAGLSWLPVHHDMGLIGNLISVCVAGIDWWCMQPDDFIRTPLRFLRCISERRIDITSMPNFGLAYLLRRVSPDQLEDLRFDSLRAVILGAERVDPRLLERFEALFSPYGLDRRALLPAFGQAEATLAVTGLPLGRGWTTARPQGVRPGVADVVGCGQPLSGMSIAIVDDRDEQVSDGVVGEIVVEGTSLAAGYAAERGPNDGSERGSGSGTRINGGRLHTGDAGFIQDRELFVLGRLGDGLKVRGRMVFAESIELELAARGIAERRAVALLGIRDGVPTAAVVIDAPDPKCTATVREVLIERVGDAALYLICVPRGRLAVTSSGKPRRRVMWRALCDGSLDGDIVDINAAPAAALQRAVVME
ncbi:AMP-binding protein [Micromonospora sp. NPDC050686]|uniref:AMP-binding protein n=1 Tax=Micromonospora sp. NPDC050686 TaxID=3154631 RepID=UPI0033C24524